MRLKGSRKRSWICFNSRTSIRQIKLRKSDKQHNQPEEARNKTRGLKQKMDSPSTLSGVLPFISLISRRNRDVYPTSRHKRESGKTRKV